MTPIFEGRKEYRSNAADFQEAKADLIRAKDEFLNADKEMMSLPEFQIVGWLKNEETNTAGDEYKKLSSAIKKYDRALKHLTRAFNNIKTQIDL
jgi:hypothetical protein